MTAAATTTITPLQMVLLRKDHEPLLVKVVVARLNGQGLDLLLFPIHEFIVTALCYSFLAGSSLLQYSQGTNLPIYD